MTIHRYEVTDAEWAIIEPMLPKHHMGRPQKDLRRLSHNLCKPPERCRIEATDRRYYIWPEGTAAWKKMPVERRSVNFCRWQTSAAWMTSRTCSRRPLPNSWRTV